MDRVSRAEPTQPVALPAFPAPAPVQRVEFIEFATSPEDAPGSQGMPTATGFARAGTHVSKPVTLWRQGGVNVLVNTGSTGFAYTSFVAHGTTVSEVAPMVPDARATQARALALLAQDHRQPGQPDELEIPAIRGVGGSTLPLLDVGSNLSRIWSVDFCSDASPMEGAGLIGIDHLGQTMAYDEMLSRALFYASTFDAK